MTSKELDAFSVDVTFLKTQKLRTCKKTRWKNYGKTRKVVGKDFAINEIRLTQHIIEDVIKPRLILVKNKEKKNAPPLPS
ncbi:MAG: hypothetical protein IIY87_07110 [Bacteroidales bacterium]|nr:hypothetical protein [Bacteroidales bacterium]